MKNLFLIIFMLFAFSVIAEGQKLKSSYDKFKDVTDVTVSNMTVKAVNNTGGRSTPMVWFTVRVLYQGTSIQKDADAFQFWFYSSSPSWVFLQYNSLVILADGERISLGKARHTGDVSAGSRNVGVRETLGYAVKRSDMEKIAKALKVELQLGSFEGVLGKDQLVAINTIFQAGTK
ncbi:MAG: hypothetical protein WBD27_00265 [Pyrinomonadaceae bacterium]